jgi:putative spermidine/putrescine transport system ATP-binding protein
VSRSSNRRTSPAGAGIDTVPDCAPQGGVAVQFLGVSKSFDGRTNAVSDLDLTVMRGEFITFLGPSGSGKTTTLMLLAGFEEVSAGAIWLNGQPLHGVPPHRRNIGMVFQSYALFPHLTVAENVAFPLRVRHRAKAEQNSRVSRVLDMVRLGGLADRKPAGLSGGQQQRVALARALVFDPQVLLLDEPLSALDRQLREEMQDELRGLHDRLGVTMINVTHDQGEALAMSDRVAIFRDGRLQQVGPPQAIYDEPANAFVAAFLGESNQLPARVLHDAGPQCLVELAGGFRAEAAKSADVAAGMPVILSVRAARVSLAPCAAWGTTNLTGKIADVTFLGDQIRLRICIGDAFTLTAKLQAADGIAAPCRGQLVTVGWQAAHARVFADTSR